MLRRAEGSSQEAREEPSSTDCADDLHLLLDCLRYHRDGGCHGSPQRQALSTIAAMCCNDSAARDHMRTSGALMFILEMVHGQPVPATLQTALMALGCAAEKNVVNQSKLCEQRLFSLLSTVLSSHDSQLTLIHSAAYLLACLMAGNGKGQNLARESSTLSALISQFKSLLPSTVSGESGDGVTCGGSVTCASSERVEVWRSVVSALCAATNNPQNEQNQQACSGVFPAAMSLFNSSSVHAHHKTAQSALTLLTSCTASNTCVQTRFHMVGGLHCLISALRRTVELKSGNETSSDLGVHIVQCISASAFGHSSNSSVLVSLGCVPLLVSLLCTPSLPLPSLTSLTLCLGMLIEDSIAAQKQVVKCGGLPILVSNMAEYKDEELSKAATFVLQCCFNNKTDQLSGERGGEGEGERGGGREGDMCAAVSSLDHWLEPQSPQPKIVCQPHMTQDTSSHLSHMTLKTLDKKLPVSTQVSSWLDSSQPHPGDDGDANTVPEADWLPRLQLLQKLLEGMDLSLMPAVEGISTQHVPSQAELDVTGVQVATKSDCHEFTLAEGSGDKQGQPGAGVSREEAEEGRCGATRVSNSITHLSTDAEKSKDKGRVHNIVNEITVGQTCTTAEQRVRSANASQPYERDIDRSVAECEAECKIEDGEINAITDHDLRYVLADSTQKHPTHLSHTTKIKTDTNKKEPFHTEKDTNIICEVEVTRHNQTGGRALQCDVGSSDQMEGISSGEAKVCLGEINQPQSGLPLACQSLPDIPKRSKGSHKPHSVVPNMNLLSSETHAGGNGLLRTPSTSGRSNTRYASITSSKRAAMACVQQPGSSVVVNSSPHPPPDQRVGQQNEAECNKTAHDLQGRGSTSSHQDEDLREGKNTGWLHSHATTQYNHASNETTPAHQPPPGRLQPLSSVRSTQCAQLCMACHPRLKCPLITSRNFLKILKVDKFTCAYHRRLVSRLTHRQNMGGHKRGTSESGIQDGGRSRTLHSEEEKAPKRDNDDTVEHHSCRSTDHHLPIMEDSLIGHTLSSSLQLSTSTVTDSSDVTYSPSSEQSADSMELYTPPPGPHTCTSLDDKSQSEDGKGDCSDGGHVLVGESVTGGQVTTSRPSPPVSGPGQRSDINLSVAMVCPTPGHAPQSVEVSQRLSQPPLSVRPHSMLAAVLGRCGESSSTPPCAAASSRQPRPWAARPHSHKHHATQQTCCKEMDSLPVALSRATDTVKRNGTDKTSGQHSSCDPQRPARQYQLTHCRPRGVAPVEGGHGRRGVAPVEGGCGRRGVAPVEGGRGRRGVAPVEGGCGRRGVAPVEGGRGRRGVAPVEGGCGKRGVAPVEGGCGRRGVAPVEGGRGRRGVAPVEGGRPPLRERGNTLRREGSEYDYSTPAKALSGRGREVQPVKHNKTVCNVQPVSQEDVGRTQRDKENSGRDVVQGCHRPAIPFSRREVGHVMEGVQQMGHRWRHILAAYPFHPSRTAGSLKDKYRNLTQRR